MIRLITSSLVAAVVLFAWGGAYWMGNPLVPKIIRPIPTEEKLTQALQAALPASGLYMVPHATVSPDTHEARLAKGPVGMIQWHAGPTSPMSATMLRGFLGGWLTCALLLFVLRQTAPSLPRFGQRWLLATAVGVLVAVQADLGGEIWWYHAADWAWLDAGYQIVGLSLAGAVLAAFTRPQSPPA